MIDMYFHLEDTRNEEQRSLGSAWSPSIYFEFIYVDKRYRCQGFILKIFALAAQYANEKLVAQRSDKKLETVSCCATHYKGNLPPHVLYIKKGLRIDEGKDLKESWGVESNDEGRKFLEDWLRAFKYDRSSDMLKCPKEQWKMFEDQKNNPKVITNPKIIDDIMNNIGEIKEAEDGPCLFPILELHLDFDSISPRDPERTVQDELDDLKAYTDAGKKFYFYDVTEMTKAILERKEKENMHVFSNLDIPDMFSNSPKAESGESPNGDKTLWRSESMRQFGLIYEPADVDFLPADVDLVSAETHVKTTGDNILAYCKSKSVCCDCERGQWLQKHLHLEDNGKNLSHLTEKYVESLTEEAAKHTQCNACDAIGRRRPSLERTDTRRRLVDQVLSWFNLEAHQETYEQRYARLYSAAAVLKKFHAARG